MKDKEKLMRKMDCITKLAKQYRDKGMTIDKAIDKAIEKYKEIEKKKYEE